MSDAYRIVSARIMRVRPTSILIEQPHGSGTVPIARSLIHGADDLRLDLLRAGPEGILHTFRLREWKAEEVGLS